jgi:hypothetical protein
MRTLPFLATLVAAGSLGAQSMGVRTSPQFVSYTLGSPTNNTISEFALPIFAIVPLNQMVTFDVGTAFASSTLKSTSGGQSIQSSISGLTDTQVRATMNLGTDLVLLTAGVNVPTGQSTVAPSQQAAAGLIGNDFLIFPISSMGSGFGGTGGVALAKPMGDWNLGAGLSVRRTLPFEPYQDTAGTKFRFVPGNESRLRLGLDHPYGTGRASIGFTYSKFSDDKLVTSVYNTGDRLLTQGYVTSAAGAGDYTLSAWNLFRTSGTRVDGTASGKEMITDVGGSWGMPVGESRLEPGLDLRTWMQQGAPTSLQTTLSVHYDRPMGSVYVSPGAGFTFGKLAANGSQTATLSGFRAQLTVRTR